MLQPSSGSDDCESSSNDSFDSYSKDSDSSDSSYSYISSNDGIFADVPRHLEGFSNFVGSVRRRAVMGVGVDSDLELDQLHINDGGNGGNANGKHNKHRGRRRGSTVQFIKNCIFMYHERCPNCCNQRVATMLLVSSFIIWLYVQTLSRPNVGDFVMSTQDTYYAQGVKDRMNKKLTREDLRKKTEELRGKNKAKRSVFQSMTEGYKKSSRISKSEIPEGCSELEWQRLNYPNCNNIHEIDLNVFGPVLLKTSDRRRHTLPNKDSLANPLARPDYVGSGLWRDVFSLQPRWVSQSRHDGYDSERVVLKMMKSEHEVDHRNLDRHRRDALVMERLTASPYVVNLYGFCANTVMTEIVEQDLEELISNQMDAAADDNLSLSTTTKTSPTRRTPLGRLELALEATKGVAALHTFSGGPIIHADIQSRQFLVDSHGRVKINDFNRCRFRPKRKETGELCKVLIPSAPGTSRSPEEYEKSELDEKLDIYSLANIFFLILTGTKPWMIEGKRSAKNLIKAGKKPQIKLPNPNPSDSSLAVLMNLAYELDPAARISASDLVSELESLVNQERAKNG